jgi:hypothetical protein
VKHRSEVRDTRKKEFMDLFEKMINNAVISLESFQQLG